MRFLEITGSYPKIKQMESLSLEAEFNQKKSSLQRISHELLAEKLNKEFHQSSNSSVFYRIIQLFIHQWICCDSFHALQTWFRYLSVWILIRIPSRVSMRLGSSDTRFSFLLFSQLLKHHKKKIS
jgi:hypothetical protein